MFYNCIEKPSLETFYKNSLLKRYVIDIEQELKELANRIEVKELDMYDLTSEEFRYFLPYFLQYQAV